VVTVACVLRSGGAYTPEWVYALRRGVARYLDRTFDFVCLSDQAVAVPWKPLPHNWPGWWAKLCLFAPGLFEGPVVYFDQDTLIIGNITELASYRGPFAQLSDFYQPKIAASGVMAWTPGPHTEAIYHAFCREKRVPSGRSDYWYAKHAPKPERLQDLFPGQLVSFKAHARHGAPEGARVVCFHGKPRPNDAAAGWAHRAWKELAYGTLQPNKPALTSAAD
jgi:hypothetical protein